MRFCLCVCPSVFHACVSVYLSDCLHACLSAYLVVFSVCLFVCVFVSLPHLPTTVCLSTWPPVCMSVCLLVLLPDRAFVFDWALKYQVSVCLSVCTYFFQRAYLSARLSVYLPPLLAKLRVCLFLFIHV